MFRSVGWSLYGVIVFAAMTLPARGATDDPDPQTTSESKAAANSDQIFELLVIGPDGKPVPNAELDLRLRSALNAEHFERGELVRGGQYGAWAKTDAEGKLVMKLPKDTPRFSIGITIPGFGPYWAGWNSSSHPETIPAKFTAELDAGWSIGGIIVDSEGRPVAGVDVGPSIRYKKRPGDMSDLYIGTDIQTDAEGRWRFDSVPASLNQVGVQISHSQFAPLRRGLARSQFEIKPDGQPAEKVTLQTGLIVTGTITDEQGRPIAGALVRTKFLNDIREATTNDEGIYKLVGCEPRMAKIIASAKGRAIDMQEVRIEPDMKPVSFRMQPGGKVRIRVVDEQGKGIPKARIFFQQWRGRYEYFEFNVNQYADKNGVWEWNEAPLDGFTADICRPDGMQLGRQLILTRDEEYIFRPPQALVISGKVVDAETKEPIKSFRVVPGVRASDTRMNWVPAETFVSTDGKYSMRRTHDSFACLVRIEASGYLPAESRDIKSNEGQVTIDFELKKGKDIAATVLMPGGEPAAKAKIALGLAGSQISVRNGEFDGQTYATRLDADDAGRFSLPPPGTPFQLVIMHPAGYAHIKSAGEPVPETITLTAWARVEGTYRNGKLAVAGVPMEIDASEALRSYGRDVPSIFTHHSATTGADGRFVFERVIPGRGWISRELHRTVENGVLEIASSVRYVAHFAAGETLRLDVGGTGVPVTGKLKPPDGFDAAPHWNFAMITARLDLPQALQASSPYITASVGRDGTFRIDDMPAGEYLLSVRFDRDPVGRISDVRFRVPPADQQPADQPIDLGVLTLER